MSETSKPLLDRIDTPIGRLEIVADAAGFLRVVRFIEDAEDTRVLPVRNPWGFTSALERYFRGDLAAIDAIPVKAAGTPFQLEVWRELRNVPCGSIISYGELARRIRRPSAARAVGLANGSNPIAIVVPCHRVIGANGSLTGYGGGIERKRWLLDHERGIRSFH